MHCLLCYLSLKSVAFPEWGSLRVGVNVCPETGWFCFLRLNGRNRFYLFKKDAGVTEMNDERHLGVKERSRPWQACYAT